jgi:hypothetical protein
MMIAGQGSQAWAGLTNISASATHTITTPSFSTELLLDAMYSQVEHLVV